MGVFDLLKPGRKEVEQTRSALDAAHDPGADEDGTVNRLIDMLLDTGIDGRGPLSSATQVAEKQLGDTGGNREEAIRKIARGTLVSGGVGGFLTGLGGFVTMPVALPVNVAEFYVQAVRMVGAIAHLRGYDVSDPRIRTAVLLTLVGSNTDEVLQKAGLATASSRATTVALRNLPPAALMVVNKAVGFRIVRGVSEKMLSRLGRGVPLAGGVVGGGIDAYMMKKIADHAMKEFPPLTGRGAS